MNRVVLIYFYGFLAAAFGCILSPQFTVVSESLTGWFDLLIRSLIVGVCLGGVSQINEFNQITFYRSKVDFIANNLITSIVGILLAVALMITLKSYVIGRWYFIMTAITFMFLVFADFILINNFRKNKIILVGFNNKKIVNILSDLGLKSEHLPYVFVDQDPVEWLRKKYKESSGSRMQYRLLFSNDLNFDINVSLLLSDSRIFKYAISEEAFIEQVFELTYIDAVSKFRWWEFPTMFKLDSFVVLKRVLDILFSIILAGVCVPLIFVAVVLVKLFDGGTVFYRQTRCGYLGKDFTIYKIRTMRRNSEMDGAQWAKISDSRVTGVGKFLRKTRIDEMPQLLNILRGDMSLIGPRPERPEFYSIIDKEIPSFSTRLICKPGLTGWAQVNYPYGASILDAKVKLMYDLYYIKNAGIVMDLRILMRTVIYMVKGAR